MTTVDTIEALREAVEIVQQRRIQAWGLGGDRLWQFLSHVNTHLKSQLDWYLDDAIAEILEPEPESEELRRTR